MTKNRYVDLFSVILQPSQILNPQNQQLIRQYALTAIEDELRSLNDLLSYVDDSFVAIVQLILDSNGRVVITGIGKSAIIAQKIVATLNSTGQPSVFMHAADAIHGDLGIIQNNDVVIAISKSGNTPEIKLLAPILKRFGNPLVAMVGNMDSELARLADYVINSTIDKEACPNNLAPTTSTTAQMLMGDALAIALLKSRNFTEKDFSQYHPGGTLGKKLYLRCGDIAARNEKPRVQLNATVKEVIHTITKNRLGATAVVNELGAIIGIITDGDIRRMLEKSENLKGILARDIMNPEPKYLESKALAVEAAEIVRSLKITQIIIKENEEYKGMVHVHDLNSEGIL